MTSRRNKDSLDNLAQQLLKIKTSIKKQAQGTKYSAISEARAASMAVLVDLKEASTALAYCNANFEKAQAAAQESQEERDALDKQVANLVKRGYHKASLQHHPDKLGDAITDEQREYWRTIQQAQEVLGTTEVRRDYFDMRDHAKFAELREKQASGAGKEYWQRRLTSSLPPKCSMPLLCEEDYLSDGTVALMVIWSCKNAASLEVTRYDMELLSSQRKGAIDAGREPPSREEELRVFQAPEAKCVLTLGNWWLRARAVNVAGTGEWSHWLQLVLKGPGDDASRQAATKVLLQQVLANCIARAEGVGSGL